VKASKMRLITVVFVILTSVLSPVRVNAEVGDSEGKTFRLDAGFEVSESSTGMYFLPSNDPSYYRSCIPLNQVGSPDKSVSDCLNDISLTLRVRNNLGPCDAVVTIPCIEDIFMRNPSSDWSKGVYIGERSVSYGLPMFGPFPQLETGIQRGGSLFIFPGIDADPSRLFEVNPTMERRAISGKLLNPQSLNVSIRGIKKLTGKWKPGSRLYGSGLDMTAADIECNASYYSNECWQHTRNSLDNQFKLVLRLPTVPFGWLNGRLFKPDITFEPVSGATTQTYRVIIAGSPVPTPRITRYYYSKVPAEYSACRLLDGFLRLTTRSTNNCFDVSPYPGNPTLVHSIKPNGTQSYLDLVGVDPDFNVATDIVDDWQVGMRFDENGTSSYNTCEKQSTFNGFAGSNALTYSANPVFNISSSSLEYVVAGPHFMPDKSTFTGVYSLIITKEYASCIWGLSSPVFKASLQVVDQDGVASNALTVIGTGEKFVQFSATGFTFSQKTVRVKFVDSSKAQIMSKKKVITCVKKKTVRTISGSKPVCPKGFKVKK